MQGTIHTDSRQNGITSSAVLDALRTVHTHNIGHVSCATGFQGGSKPYLDVAEVCNDQEVQARVCPNRLRSQKCGLIAEAKGLQ